jgi:cytochrome c1
MHRLQKVKILLVAFVALWMFAQASQTVMSRNLVRQSDELPESSGVQLVRNQCLSCHEADLIVQQRLSKAGWTRELDKMIRWGAVVNEADREPMIEYLTRHFGSRPFRAMNTPDTATTDDSVIKRGKAIFENRCLSCHEADLTEQQRLSRTGWTREVEKMMRWGAIVSDDEKEPLVSYLFKTWGTRPLKTSR